MGSIRSLRAVRRRDRARWRARHFAAGFRTLTSFVPRELADACATAARQHRVSLDVVIDAALGHALRQLTPSAIQHAVQQRRQRLGGLPR